MRRIIATLLVGSLCIFAACSYGTDFVVVNESDVPVTIRYDIKDFPGPFYVPTVPKVIPTSQLGESDKQWDPVQFEVDEVSRSVTTRLMPGQALRIASMINYRAHDDPNDEYKYQIRRITVSGERGELNFTGEQARTAFTYVSRSLYALTYK